MHGPEILHYSCRDAVIEAFEQRPEWSVEVLRDAANTIHPDASCSDFHWGEYERIDWQKVHKGKHLNHHLQTQLYLQTHQLKWGTLSYTSIRLLDS